MTKKTVFYAARCYIHKGVKLFKKKPVLVEQKSVWQNESYYRPFTGKDGVVEMPAFFSFCYDGWRQAGLPSIPLGKVVKVSVGVVK